MTRAEQIERAAREYLETLDAAYALDPLSTGFSLLLFERAAADCAAKMDALRAALALPEVV